MGSFGVSAGSLRGSSEKRGTIRTGEDKMQLQLETRWSLKRPHWYMKLENLKAVKVKGLS